MIEVKLSFPNTSELLSFFSAVGDWKGVTQSSVEFPTLPATAAVVEESPTPAPAKKTRAKKSEAAAAEAVVDEAPAAPEPETKSGATYTVDDVRKALQELVNRTEFAVGSALVKEFGASRITEIPPEKYAEFIAAAAAKVAA